MKKLSALDYIKGQTRDVVGSHSDVGSHGLSTQAPVRKHVPAKMLPKKYKYEFRRVGAPG